MNCGVLSATVAMLRRRLIAFCLLQCKPCLVGIVQLPSVGSSCSNGGAHPRFRRQALLPSYGYYEQAVLSRYVSEITLLTALIDLRLI